MYLCLKSEKEETQVAFSKTVRDQTTLSTTCSPADEMEETSPHTAIVVLGNRQRLSA
jgi:hypothetical protein